MQNLFIGKGNLASSPELKMIAGRNGDFEVATMRVMFARYGRDESTDEVRQVGALLHKSISGQAPPNPSRGYATAAV